MNARVVVATKEQKGRKYDNLYCTFYAENGKSFDFPLQPKFLSKKQYRCLMLMIKDWCATNEKK